MRDVECHMCGRGPLTEQIYDSGCGALYCPWSKEEEEVADKPKYVAVQAAAKKAHDQTAILRQALEEKAKKEPYLEEKQVVVIRKYNPDYGDDRICECGHAYYRHFDTYEDMQPVGCKYCYCPTFVEEKGRLVKETELPTDYADLIDNIKLFIKRNKLRNPNNHSCPAAKDLIDIDSLVLKMILYVGYYEDGNQS